MFQKSPQNNQMMIGTRPSSWYTPLLLLHAPPCYTPLLLLHAPPPFPKSQRNHLVCPPLQAVSWLWLLKENHWSIILHVHKYCFIIFTNATCMSCFWRIIIQGEKLHVFFSGSLPIGSLYAHSFVLDRKIASIQRRLVNVKITVIETRNISLGYCDIINCWV